MTIAHAKTSAHRLRDGPVEALLRLIEEGRIATDTERALARSLLAAVERRDAAQATAMFDQLFGCAGETYRLAVWAVVEALMDHVGE